MSEMVSAASFPPGEYIRDELEARGWTQEDLARILNRPIRLVNEILSGKRSITTETARGLAAAFGNHAQTWLNLESAYRLSLVEQDDGGVSDRAKLYTIAPVREMIRRGWINECKDHVGLSSELCKFFDTDSIQRCEEYRLRAAARMGTEYGQFSAEQRAWLRRVEMLASTVISDRFDPGGCDSILNALRPLLVDQQSVAKVPTVLLDHGIKFMIVEHLPKTRFDGVAFWLDEGVPVIAMSLRLDRLDSFWFTLLHELGHIFHNDRHIRIDSDLAAEDLDPHSEIYEAERKANTFARDTLLPKARLDDFIRSVNPYFSRGKITKFASEMRVHPGIVIGQLQKCGAIPYSQGRDMLVKVRALLTNSAITDGWGIIPGYEP